MDLDGIGYARHLQEQRAKILANVPASARARILGRPAPYAAPKAHAISVNCRTGERTVVPIAPMAAPKPEPRPEPVRRIIVEYPNRPAPSGPSPETIISAILTATGISLYEYLREARSSYRISRARQMGYWLTKQVRPDMSLNELGRMFRKDHTSVLAGARKGEALKDIPPISDWLAHPAIAALLNSNSPAGVHSTPNTSSDGPAALTRILPPQGQSFSADVHSPSEHVSTGRALNWVARGQNSSKVPA